MAINQSISLLNQVSYELDVMQLRMGDLIIFANKDILFRFANPFYCRFI